MFKVGSHRMTLEQVEREADRIADPLERLRYLRQHSTQTVASITPPEPRTRSWRLVLIAASLVLAAGLGAWMMIPASAPPAPKAAITPIPRPSPNQVWQVAGTQIEEVYSNGLRVDTSFATRNRPRGEFPIFSLSNGGSEPIATGREPVGIIFHTTESDIVPFEQEASRKIDTLGHMLLRFVRRERSYHYIIDRFGRVFRIVEESDAANHAGFSVWGDDRGVYVNLNDSFIGISFEGTSSAPDDISGAQLAAARQLTEMLVSRYNIRPEDCVTHAQVSVNPQNMRLGNHKDWAKDFPFAAMNLPDNYRLPVAAVEAFGVSYDEDLLAASAGKPWPGLISADRKLMETAASQGASEVRYRGMLRHRFQEILALRKAQQLAAQEEQFKGR